MKLKFPMSNLLKLNMMKKVNMNLEWILKEKKKKKRILASNTKMILKLINNAKMEEKKINNKMITKVVDSTKVAWIILESNLKKKPNSQSLALKSLWLTWLNI